jgi:hypothetical protein
VCAFVPLTINDRFFFRAPYSIIEALTVCRRCQRRPQIPVFFHIPMVSRFSFPFFVFVKLGFVFLRAGLFIFFFEPDYYALYSNVDINFRALIIFKESRTSTTTINRRHPPSHLSTMFRTPLIVITKLVSTL